MLFLRAVQVGHVGEEQASVVGSVLTQGELAVDVDVIHDDELAIFVYEAVGLAFELLCILRRPPVAEIALGVELLALVVEAVGELVADDTTDVSIIHGVIYFGIVEVGLQNTGREVDVVHAGVVVGIYGRWCHAPLAMVYGLADFVQLAVVFKRGGAEGVAEGIFRFDEHCRIVAEVVGVTDFVGDAVQLLFSANLGGGAHPVQAVEVAIHGGFNIADHFEHLLLAVAGEVLPNVDLTERLAQSSVYGVAAALPAFALRFSAVQLATVEVEVLRIEALRKVAGVRGKKLVAEVSAEGFDIGLMNLIDHGGDVAGAGIVDFCHTRGMNVVFELAEDACRELFGYHGDGDKVIDLLGVAALGNTHGCLGEGGFKDHDGVGVFLRLLGCDAAQAEHL